MQAYVVRADGGRWSVAWEEHPEPACPADGVVVEPSAVALAWSDVLQQEGGYVGAVPDPPFVSGHEFAGRVVEAGARAAGVAVGDRVFGFLPGPAAFADRVAAPGRSVRRVPDGLGDVKAAAITTSFLTADVGLFVVGGLVPGATLLVHAAAGGVGRSAVQLARVTGVEVVVATAGSAQRRADAAALGARVAGYDDFPDLVREVTGGRGIDVALESVSGEVFDRTLKVMAPGGRLVTVGASSGVPPRRLGLPMLWQRSVTVGGLHLANLLATAPELLEPSWRRVLDLATAGAIDPGVGLVVGRHGIPRAARALRGRTVPGRVVVDLTR